MFPLYLLIINAAAFFLMLADKRKAQKNRWRIPEKWLLFAAVIGGSFGMLAGMKAFHHKTRKALFSIGVPVILSLQLVGLIILYITVICQTKCNTF
ncbi:MAG: DUF1294 domain-containing protein [Ruminococcaceae bacterium]|nr:DUF1294 domain-containing protein [Oscillospiraceae bacterium]